MRRINLQRKDLSLGSQAAYLRKQIDSTWRIVTISSIMICAVRLLTLKITLPLVILLL